MSLQGRGQSEKLDEAAADSPPMVMALALGVAPPSLSWASFAAPERDWVAGDDR